MIRRAIVFDGCPVDSDVEITPHNLKDHVWAFRRAIEACMVDTGERPARLFYRVGWAVAVTVSELRVLD